MVSIPFNGPLSPLRDLFISMKATTTPLDSRKSKYRLTIELVVDNRSKKNIHYDSGLYSAFTTTTGTQRIKFGKGILPPGKSVVKGGGTLKPNEQYAFSYSLRRAIWKVGSSASGRATG